MPLLTEHRVATKANVLIAGDSGAGKTSLLSTLANAGYPLWVFDFDAGLDILASLVKPDKKKFIRYRTLRDDILARPKAYLEFKGIIEKGWKDDDMEAPIQITDLGPENVIVIDTATFLGDATLEHVKAINPGLKDERLYYGDAMEPLVRLFSFLTGDRIKANFVCLTHIVYQDDQDGRTKAFPSILGKALPKKLGTYFPNVFRLEVKPTGERVLKTASNHQMNLKNAAPNLIGKEASADLAEVLRLIRDNAKEEE